MLCSACGAENATQLGDIDVWLCESCRADAQKEIG